MDDDGSQVIESLDSLWFLSNVFSPTSPKPLQELVFEKASEPTSQVLQNQQSHESPRCTRCGELSAETEPEMWKPVDDMEVVVEMESPRWTEKEERKKMRRRRTRRSKRSIKQSREILVELDWLCFDGNEVCETWILEGNCGYYYEQSSFGGGDQNKYKILPPFDDNTAMKEHLKSWAYAVACTVR
ncbi:hypothetical protein FNV43_RR07381 [Rhamnella rubrinervis]|uniref:Uncharacterized protein n=1 Tax=Rhamnella rubrinervis TaxID=2594499 RepID=A0A8K0HF62_9ROSA|nr:hypothetical protein FNV43_RR07381 [Rhamnella rubrinervis]